MVKFFAGLLAVALFIALVMPAYAQEGEEGKKDCDKRITREDYARFEKEIREAIAEGKITPEEGRAKLERIRRAMADQEEKKTDRKECDKKDPGEWIPKVLEEKGELTEEQIKQVMEVIRKIMAEIKEEGEEFELNEDMKDYLCGDVRLTDEQIELVIACARRGLYSMEEEKKRGECSRESDKKTDMENAAKRIRAAVERGDLTEEEARKKLQELRRRMAAEEGERDKQVDWDSIIKRIKAAVERGDLTEEEARKKLQELRRRMAGEEKDKPRKSQ